MNGSLIFLSYTLSLSTTFAIEVPLIYFLFKRYGDIENDRIIKSGCVAQLITHPTSFLIIPTLSLYIDMRMNLGNPFWVRGLNNFVFYEFIIPIVEGIFYSWYLKPSRKYKAYLFSVIANLASWGLGSFIDDRQLAETILSL